MRLLLGLYFEPSAWVLLLLLPLTGFLVPALRLRRGNLLLSLAAALVLVGLARSGLTASEPDLLPRDGEGVISLRGVIDDDPEDRGRALRFTLRAEEVDRGEGWQETSDKVLVWAPPPKEVMEARGDRPLRYGDELLLEGELAPAPEFEGFDYGDYLARQGIHATMSFPRVELLDQGQGNPLLSRIYDFRHGASRALSEALPEPQASVAQALLLGLRGDLDPGLREDFRDTGTSHLLAISGLHVGVLLMVTLGASVWLLGRRRQHYLLVPLVLIWLYALLSGLSPSVLRAAIMGSVYLGALGLGRPRSILPALALAAAIMAGLNPQVLREVSFQLSFTAVAGIALLGAPLTRWTHDRLGIPEGGAGLKGSVIGGVAALFAVSLAATVATVPLVAFNFQQVPTLGILATVLALPVMPLVLGTSALAMAGEAANHTLGQALGWLAWVPISYLKWVVQLFALVPGSAIAVPKFGIYLVWTYYGVLALVLLKPVRLRLGIKRVALSRRSLETWRPAGVTAGLLAAAGALSIFAAVAWAQVFSPGDGRLHVLFLDVGQGDSILIVSPEGRRILVDGGPDRLAVSRRLDAHLPFWDRGLDLVVATHADEDHLRGLVEVLRRRPVEAVAQGPTDDSALHLEWQQALDEAGLESELLAVGQVIDLGDEPLRLEVLHPPPQALGGEQWSLNNGSVVLRLSYGEVSFLLAADIEAEAEAVLLSGRAYVGSTVLKVAHHGSRTSTTAAFLEEVSPWVAVIQAGEDNRHRHPHDDVVQRLQGVVTEDGLYSTAVNGTVELITDGRSLWVKTER